MIETIELLSIFSQRDIVAKSLKNLLFLLNIGHSVRCVQATFLECGVYFTATENRDQVLSTLTQGVLTLSDPQCLKPAFSILRHLVQEWVDVQVQDSPFVAFVYKEILPACLLAPSQPGFDLHDAQTALVSAH